MYEPYRIKVVESLPRVSPAARRQALEKAASLIGLHLSEPQHAFLVQGDDRLGALVGIHERLYEAGVNVYGSNGVTDGRGGFGYVLYVRPSDFEAAAAALGV